MKSFCFECFEDKTINIKNVEAIEEVSGSFVKYDAKIARCTTCQREVFIKDVFDENFTNFANALKRNSVMDF